MNNKITVALAGNPNSGKTTIFNMLTGARQHVGNYPGVTVEKKQGLCKYAGYEMTVVDLPGTYSLTAYSIEELIARNFIIEERPDVVVDIVDASNIERNLYLATQLIEMNAPLVLAFNMSDIAEQKGLIFDNGQLSGLLEAAIVPTVGNRAKGKAELLEAIIETAQQGKTERIHKVSYGEEIEEELARLEVAVGDKEPELAGKYGARWLAIKLLEQDSVITAKVHSREVLELITTSFEHLRAIFGEEPEIIIADRRYGFISGACEESVKSSVELRHTSSDIADKVILNRALGLPIFLLLMYLVFKLTFWIGGPLTGWMEEFFGWAVDVVSVFWPAGTESPVKSFLVDGIIGGVGGVLVFLPNILLLFLAIAILEDSGYMARAAFIVDRIMHKIGLHGKSFIPMLIGFGCSIPAIMATRVLENRRNRLTTIMVVPLMSCGAKLPIYTLIIPAFFAPRWQGLMLWSIYLIGIILAIICAKLLRISLFKGETTPFVMELPPYRIPTIRGVFIHMWERGWLFLKKAGTIILLISVILWAATSYPKLNKESLSGLDEVQMREAELTYSVAGRVGKMLEPVVRPLGFDWRISTALLGALGAKEVFVAQMGILYSLGEAEVEQGSLAADALRAKLRARYSPLVGFCIMLFTLISAPCIATFVICKRETGSWGWALFQFAGLSILAYVITLIVYQVGSLFAD